MGFCTNCGSARTDNAFCTECGHRFPVAPAAPIAVNEPAAAMEDPILDEGPAPLLENEPPSEPVTPARMEPLPVRDEPVTAPVVTEKAASTGHSDVTPSRGPSRRWVLGTAAAVLVAVAATLGLTSALRDDGNGASVVDRAAADEAAAAPTEPSSPSPEPIPDPTPTPTPPPIPERACWDGSTVPEGTPCAQTSGEGAMQFVFSNVDLSSDACERERGLPTDGYLQEGWSFQCVVDGESVHIAEYVGPRARDRRIARYGGCNPDLSRRPDECIAGPLDDGVRFVKTYAAGTGLLFYVSSAAGLTALDLVVLRPADELLLGDPTT